VAVVDFFFSPAVLLLESDANGLQLQIAVAAAIANQTGLA